QRAYVPLLDRVEARDVLPLLVADGIAHAEDFRPRGENHLLIVRHPALPELRAVMARHVRQAAQLTAQPFEVLDDLRRLHPDGTMAERVAVVVAAHRAGKDPCCARGLA